MVVSACATTNTRTPPTAAPDLVRRFALDYEHVPAAPVGLPGDVRTAWEAMRAGDAVAAAQALELVSAAGRETAGASTVEGFLMLAYGATAEARF